MKTGITYLWILLFLPLAMHAQDEPQPADNDLQVSAEEGILLELSGETSGLQSKLESSNLNRITLRQMGDQNEATLKQIGGTPAMPNLMEVNQSGNSNVATATQDGSNQALALDQYGSGNRHLAQYEGEWLLNSILQKGNNNVVEQYLTGSRMNFSLRQEGSGHEIIQREDGTGVGYKVTQKGSGMKVIIEQQHVISY